MGLDMYLTITLQVVTPEAQAAIANALDDVVPAGDILEVTIAVGYWRKANAIHKWFVDNVQDGKDDCGEYYVSADQLNALHDTVQEVLDNPDRAQELLPPQDGFFFGSTDIDDSYFDDLRHTLGVIEKTRSTLLKLRPSVLQNIYYSSSW